MLSIKKKTTFALIDVHVLAEYFYGWEMKYNTLISTACINTRYNLYVTPKVFSFSEIIYFTRVLKKTEIIV